MGWVMATLAVNLGLAVAQKLTAAQNHRDAKTETQNANEDMATADIDIHKFANFLHGRHENDARALGDYGFDTSDAPSLEKPQISTIPILSHKQLDHIVFGSIMTSMVNFDLKVHKGQSIDSPFVILPAFGELAMTKGYSACIIENFNPLKEGIVKVIVHK